MHHCVASYAANCRRGNKSVWSMRVETPEGDRFRVLTIVVRNGSRRLAARIVDPPNRYQANGSEIVQHRRFSGAV